MTLTAVFESLEDMMDFARNLVGSKEAAQTFLSGGEVYRQSESSRQVIQEEPAKDEGQPVDTNEAVTEPTEFVKEQKNEEPGYTLVQVREKLAELQKSGKRAQVQELIVGFGVKKLTEIPEDKYSELMQKAGEL